MRLISGFPETLKYGRTQLQKSRGWGSTRIWSVVSVYGRPSAHSWSSVRTITV